MPSWKCNDPKAETIATNALSRALQLELLSSIGVDNGERHGGLVGVGIVERVPEGVALAEELLAADLVPVLLRVGRAGNGAAALGASN